MQTTHKVNLSVDDLTGPSIEAKDFVCKVDGLLGGQIVNLLPTGSWSVGDIFGSQLLV